MKHILVGLIGIVAMLMITFVAHHMSYWTHVAIYGGDFYSEDDKRHLGSRESEEKGFIYQREPYESLTEIKNRRTDGLFMFEYNDTTISKGFFYDKD